MYRRLLRPLLQLLIRRQKRPLSAFALCMVVLMATGGPAVCVLDCWLHDLRAAQSDPQGLHQHHHAVDEAGSPGVDTPGARHEQHRSDSDGNAPSALTIAVVLALMLMLPLSRARRLLHEALDFTRSLAIPPPQRPPRFCSSIACVAA